MKFFLTSAGIVNPSLRDALVDMLGKPIEEATALFVPTAIYGLPKTGPEMSYKCITGQVPSKLPDIGWKSVGVLELTALPTLKPDAWVPVVEAADALLVNGGDCLYLAHWMRQSGLAELMPTLRRDMVYVGLSAGSMIMAPSFGGSTFGKVNVPGVDGRGLGFVDFAIYPHLEHEMFPDNTIANCQRWAAKERLPTYAIDDDTGVRSIDGRVDVISEGAWQLCTPD